MREIENEFTDEFANLRPYHEVVADISELARTYLDERKFIADMRREIKRNQTKTRLFIVGEAFEFLKPETSDHIRRIKKAGGKMTLDTIDALIVVELGEDHELYEMAKFNVQTSEGAFKMLDTELSAYQSKFKKDAAELNNLGIAERYAGQNQRGRN